VDVDELAEVRAALEAVAQDPVAAVEPTAEVLFEAPEPQAPASVDLQAPAPVVSPASAAVVDSLVLTLATPPTAFTVAKASATLGRGQENTIRLDDLSVSRRHARIAYRQGGYWLSDLGSMGGTWVDGTRLNAPRRIAAGDVIDIGLCRLTVSFVGGAAKAEPKKSTSKPPTEVTAQVKRRR
jgi:FHA domain